ncbi:MAG: hypothetical protein ACPG5P_07015, partial [Saprospiraceae bacterium]
RVSDYISESDDFYLCHKYKQYDMKSQNYKYLKTLNKGIKSGDETVRQQAFEKLLDVDQDSLVIGDLQYYYYLKAKYYYKVSKDTERMESMLKKAYECHDKVWILAQKFGTKYTNPKFIFCHAWVMYRLYELAEDTVKKKFLYARSKFFLKYGLAIHPDNNSLIFLKNKMRTNEH